VSDPTKSASATVTITAGIAFFGSLPATLQVSRSATVSALIGPWQNADGSAQVQWSVSCGSKDCGSFASTVTYNEMGATYTAPATVPIGNSVTVTATSAADPTQKVSAGVAITPQAPILANGRYVFQITSRALNQTSPVSGVFEAENGTITGGELDTNSLMATETGTTTTVTTSPLFEQITGGSYSTAPDGSLQISLTGSGSDGSSTISLNGTLLAGANGIVGQLYGAGGAGTLEAQSSVNAPLGGYAVSLFGEDKDDHWAWMGGILNIDSPGAISGTGSVLDVQDYEGGAEYFGMGQTLGASAVSVPDAWGRVVFKLNASQSTSSTTINLAGYITDGSHIRLIETGSDGYAGVLIGLALGQGAYTGKLTTASFAGSSYVFAVSGMNTGSPYDAAGVFTGNADGTVSGTLSWSDTAENSNQPRPFTGTWTIDPTGRITLSNLSDGASNQKASFAFTLEFYMTGDGSGLVLSDNPGTYWLAGPAFQQQSGTLDANAFTGVYGMSFGEIYMNPPGTGGQVWSNYGSGQFTSAYNNGADELTGFADSYVTSNYPIFGSLANSANGILLGNLTGLYPLSLTESNPYNIYLIDSNRAVAIELDNQALSIGNLTRLQ
jgi:hypothetical protein